MNDQDSRDPDIAGLTDPKLAPNYVEITADGVFGGIHSAEYIKLNLTRLRPSDRQGGQMIREIVAVLTIPTSSLSHVLAALHGLGRAAQTDQIRWAQAIMRSVEGGPQEGKP